jgi:hypothetical protein
MVESASLYGWPDNTAATSPRGGVELRTNAVRAAGVGLAARQDLLRPECAEKVRPAVARATR